LNEAIEFHRSLPPHKVMVKKLRIAKETGDIYATTGMGKATIEEQLDLLTYVEKEGLADILGTSVDSFSRQKNFRKAQEGILESIEKGKSVLNGLPVVNHGVRGIRKLVEAVNCPIHLRYGAFDPRLIDEIGYAGGHTGGAADAMMDFWHHNTKVPLETVIRTHQYCQRLVGYYEERGVELCPSCQGFYGAGVPPSLQMATILTQVLMMAEQGAKHIRLHFSAHGNLVQDVATGRTLYKLAHEYLQKLGYVGVEIFLQVSFSLVQYPLEIGASFAVIFMNTLMAKLCGAQLNDIRTVAEAKTIPTKEDIAITYRTAKMIANLMKSQKIHVDEKELSTEATMVEKEVRCIIDKVLEMGDGDVVVGTIRAVEVGVLDHPFAANPAAQCKVMGIKDGEGAIRYMSHGNLPFTSEIIEFHRRKIAEREKKSGKKLDYQTVVADLLSVSKGFLVG
ncbi:MAG: methylaspartate mutase subunit E, partial [candidate division WOR-3 bacterium]